MQFARPLVRGTLLRRYKRFLADVKLEDGREATAHCANPGAMLGVADPGATVWLEPNDDPKRKLKLSWKLTELAGGHLAGIDTSVPNAVVGEALRGGGVPGLEGYAEVRAEVRYGERSRVDFLLTHPGRPPAYVEVKNVHLRRGGALAEFPDSVTARGAKHLGELARVAAAGERAVLLYLVQRTDCTRLALAADIDPGYAAAAAAAREAGVESLAFGAYISRAGVELGRPLAVAAPGATPRPSPSGES
ncbi:MAG TPA: DNA/RNA nuclease SfsA [Paracoccaceae bacterium]|nr:DNA/RNA nuclease SfsA [Paracoccaceae bacterium]